MEFGSPWDVRDGEGGKRIENCVRQSAIAGSMALPNVPWRRSVRVVGRSRPRVHLGRAAEHAGLVARHLREPFPSRATV
jgi:hypothetical protein